MRNWLAKLSLTTVFEVGVNFIEVPGKAGEIYDVGGSYGSGRAN
jgi:hypothetical protein